MYVAPSPPSDVSVSQNGLGSLLVSWTPGDITATGYVIYYQQHNPPWQRFLEGDEADTTSATITRLMAGATYSISVASTSGTLPSTATAAPYDVTIGNNNCCNDVVIGNINSPQSQPPSSSPPLPPLLWLESLSLSPALSLCLME